MGGRGGTPSIIYTKIALFFLKLDVVGTFNSYHKLKWDSFSQSHLISPDKLTYFFEMPKP